jgi:hypothetical protein
MLMMHDAVKQQSKLRERKEKRRKVWGKLETGK